MVMAMMMIMRMEKARKATIYVAMQHRSSHLGLALQRQSIPAEQLNTFKAVCRNNHISPFKSFSKHLNATSRTIMHPMVLISSKGIDCHDSGKFVIQIQKHALELYYSL